MSFRTCFGILPPTRPCGKPDILHEIKDFAKAVKRVQGDIFHY